MLKSRQKLRRSQQEKPSSDILDDVKPIADIQRFPSFVLYGRSGTGKTTLAATFPKPILYLDVKDEGTDSIADVEGIMVKDIRTFEDFELVYWSLQKDASRFKTIVIDTVSQLQQIVVLEHAASMKRKRGAENRQAGDWGTLTKRDWGDIAGLMKEWLVNYRDLGSLGMHVVFIAQDRTFNVDDEEGSEQLTPEIGPGLSPSIAKTLNAAVGMIGNTFIRERQTKGKGGKTREKLEYCLRIGPNPVYITKVRKPRSIEPPSVIVDPSFEDIMSIIRGEE
jgi:hypothetical protein